MPTFVTRETYQGGVLISTDTVEVPDEVTTERTLVDRAEAALVDLRAVANGTGPMTAAQLTVVVRGLARAVAALIRLQLRRLDSAE